MDPLSLTASIIAVFGAGGSLVKGLRKLLSLKDVPVFLLQLSDELSDTSRVVLASQTTAENKIDI